MKNNPVKTFTYLCYIVTWKVIYHILKNCALSLLTKGQVYSMLLALSLRIRHILSSKIGYSLTKSSEILKPLLKQIQALIANLSTWLVILYGVLKVKSILYWYACKVSVSSKGAKELLFNYDYIEVSVTKN